MPEKIVLFEAFNSQKDIRYLYDSKKVLASTQPAGRVTPGNFSASR